MANITVKQLACGIRLIHEQRKESKVSAVTLRLCAGSLYEEKIGVAHLLEHLVLDGTKQYPTKFELENLIGQHGGRGGGKTPYESVQYWATVPQNFLEAALRYVYETAFHPLLREEDFVREQKVVFQEAKRRDSQSIELARQKVQGALFRGSPLERTVIGTPEDVQRLLYKDALDFWGAHYRSAGAVVGVVTAEDFESTCSLVEKVFSEVQPDAEVFSPARVSVAEQRLSEPTLFFVDDQQADQNRLVISHRIPGFFDESKPAGDLLASILGGGKTSRLFHAVRHEKGLAYDTIASTMTGADYGRFMITSGTTPELVAEMFEIIGLEIQRICRDGVTDEEIGSAKERVIFNNYVQNEKAQDRAETLSWVALHAEQPEVWLDVESRYKKVTKEDIQNVAQSIFSSHPAIAVVKRPSDMLSVDVGGLVFTSSSTK